MHVFDGVQWSEFQVAILAKEEMDPYLLANMPVPPLSGQQSSSTADEE
jgi:hypothetical protein